MPGVPSLAAAAPADEMQATAVEDEAVGSDVVRSLGTHTAADCSGNH
jgi:hypothetical protein